MAKKQENESALKHLFNKAHLQRLSKALLAADPNFDAATFNKLMPQLEPLEMKGRVQLIRDELFARLPSSYTKAVQIFLLSVRKEKLSGFDLWPYTEFVQTYGLKHLKISLDALKELTMHFTSEWAIRPFLKAHPKEALAYLEKCSKDKETNVRRWASEGSRPRLPWGERLPDFIKDPSATTQILENLKFDSELFIRKSVANHLNDIAKDNPLFVIRILKDWKKSAGAQHTEKIDWIIRHALRSLIKAGNPMALQLIGVSKETRVELRNFKIDKKNVKLGDRITFNFSIHSQSKKDQKIVIDYIIHFVKANGKTAPKVFKLKTLELPANKHIQILKNHHLKKISTRVFYAGVHKLEIQVNGQVLNSCQWKLSLT